VRRSIIPLTVSCLAIGVNSTLQVAVKSGEIVAAPAKPSVKPAGYFPPVLFRTFVFFIDRLI
jgi:hypothetical protein